MSAQQPNRFARSGLCLLAISTLLGGCARLLPSVDTPEPPQSVATSPAAPEHRPVLPPVLPPKPAQVAILLSDDVPVFVSVADQLRRRLGDEHHTIHILDGHPANTRRILEEVESSDPDQVISIGLLAAQVGRQLDDVPMVFCCVFNYQEHDLISSTSKGVNLLPPFSMQLEAWRKFSPNLERIGVISGPSQDALIAEIKQAAAEVGIELLSRTVHSDQEALYGFKRLAPEIQGLWLLPDNRILSPRVIREIMSYGGKHRIQIVVFGSGLLNLGGLMAITSRVGDVADQVVARLEHKAEDGRLTGPGMMPLTQMDLEINQDIARHLGLILSERSARAEQSE